MVSILRIIWKQTVYVLAERELKGLVGRPRSQKLRLDPVRLPVPGVVEERGDTMHIRAHTHTQGQLSQAVSTPLVSDVTMCLMKRVAGTNAGQC